ncbi:hypothetical protein BHE97_04740 [Aeromicrobium sp. PE09-221]|uniref:VOC family protein n=1 Tax=Aeromicrobium sp. PE09-221 TaxID=1898043 RepID=UPI000B3ECF60|nr:VOC family protein [Aeromicrobium sp. PE09-221]OUZ11163.1 hypothetical protein BHE97_04740 [Aeromicrobium sp. PE09-221]
MTHPTTSIADVAALHHIGIVTTKDDHVRLVRNLVEGLGGEVEFEVEDEPLDVLATWVPIGPGLRFEVVSPRSEAPTPITRFLAKAGGGLHHVSLETEEIGVCRELVTASGMRTVGENDDHGGWAEFFLDPSQTGRALLHWMQAV